MEILSNWSELLSQRKARLVPNTLEESLRYLRDTRIASEGWGTYPGVASDLHSSALAIEALHASSDSKSVGIVADAATYLRMEMAQRKHLKLQEVTDLLTVAVCDKKSNGSYNEDLLARLHKIYTGIDLVKHELSIRDLCSSILAVARTGKQQLSRFGWLMKYLFERQRPEDGSWSAFHDGPGSVIATAQAVRVFSHVGGGHHIDRLERALGYLHKCLDEFGWLKLGATGDIFTQAVVLRALAEAPVSGTEHYQRILDGVDALYTGLNSDMGWGGNKGAPSTVEHTSLCVLALVAAGETHFVPERLAHAALQDGEHQLHTATEKWSKLQQEFEQKVQDSCGRVVQERDQLQREVKSLQSEVKSLHHSIELAKEVGRSKGLLRQSSVYLDSDLLLQDFLEVSEGRIRARRIFGFFTQQQVVFSLIALGVIVVAITLIISFLLPSSIYQLIGIVIAPVLIGFVAFLAYRENQSTTELFNRYEKLIRPSRRARGLRPEISILVSDYTHISGHWPRELQEEVVYRLFSDLRDMPPDLARNYGRVMADSFGLAKRDAGNIEVWLEGVTRLTPSERRVLLDQLRRVILR